MMSSLKLEKARKYEAENGSKIKGRPGFHLTPLTGWMNDPNGFSYYGGCYHLFYQYHPYNTNWGPMHWGHAKSKDLLKWEYLPAVLAPDELHDSFGCFSGCAVTTKQGSHLLMYTGVRKVLESNKIKEYQVQCIAVGNGVDYVKYETNPVISGETVPEDSSTTDFRDPKIFLDEDLRYSCIVANRRLDAKKHHEGSGQILLYKSDDLYNWEFKSVLISNDNNLGRMWECPDFFKMDEKYILIVSPQDMQADGMEYVPGNGAVCLIGEYDVNAGRFTQDTHHCIDYGIDFYAPQTVLAQDGRRIMIGWMQNWDTATTYNRGHRWFGQTSLPREIFLKDNRMYQLPIREIENYRKNKVEHRDVCIKGEVKLDRVFGRETDMEMRFTQAEGTWIQIRFAMEGKIYSSVEYDFSKEILTIDRMYSGTRRSVLNSRSTNLKPFITDGKKSISLRIILDKYSAEIFANGGEKVMSMVVETKTSARQIGFYSDNEVRMDLVKYDLEMIS